MAFDPAPRRIDATAGRVLPGALATPACIAGPWDDMVAGQWLWTYAGSSGCVPDGATPSAEVFRVVPSASAPYAGGTFDPSTARLQGPALTRTAEGGMTIANGRVWVTNFDPPKVVSFQALAPLPDWTETRASTAWWVRWGWLLVGLTALILVGGALLRLRRRGELTAR